MQTLDRIAVAGGIDRLVTLLPRLTPRHGLSLVAGSTLATLERAGPHRVTDLAEAQGVTQPAMTGLVDRLQARDLVRRCPDPRDRRIVNVTITDAGRALLGTRRRERAERLAELLAALTPDDQAAIAAAVPALARLVSGGLSA